MKFIVSRITFLTLAFVTFSNLLHAQGDKANRPSPPAVATGKIGEATVTISYGSPSVKGRKIWGELVPYGKVWRAGANEATILETEKDVFVDGKKVKAGKYSIYAIPGEREWQIIINSQTGQWGIKRGGETTRLPENDVVLVTVRPWRIGTPPGIDQLMSSIKSPEMAENLQYEVNKSGFVLKWENLQVSVPVVQVDAKTWTNVNYAGDSMKYHNMDVYVPNTNKLQQITFCCDFRL